MSSVIKSFSVFLVVLVNCEFGYWSFYYNNISNPILISVQENSSNFIDGFSVIIFYKLNKS